MFDQPRQCAEHVVLTYPRSAQEKDSDSTTLACCVSAKGETDTQHLVHYQYRYGIAGWLVVMPKAQMDQIIDMSPKQLETAGVTCYEYVSRVRWFGRGRRYRLKKVFGADVDQATLAVGAKLVR